jgi:hypothetical protein
VKAREWKVEVEGSVPPALVEICRSRRAVRVRSILGRHYVVELQTRDGAGSPIFLRVNEQGEQIRFAGLLGSEARPVQSVAELWPIENETKAA